MPKLSELSEEERQNYLEALSKLNPSELKEERRTRYDEMTREEGVSSSEAVAYLDGEEALLREYQKDKKIRERKEAKMAEESEPEVEETPTKKKVGTFLRKTGLVGKDKTYLEEGVEGALTLGVETAGKLLHPKEREVKRVDKSGRVVVVREREPSLRDLGRGSLQAERYEPKHPDFFGVGTPGEFDFGVRSPVGTTQKRERPPATEIPFLATRPPSTGIPSVGKRPPSTKIVGRPEAPIKRIIRPELPSTRIPGKGKVGTRVPKEKGRPPSTKISGTGKVSTRVPKTQKVRVTTKPFKSLKPREVRVSKPDPVEILGLKEFW